MFYNKLLKDFFYLDDKKLKQLKLYYFFLKEANKKNNLTALLSEKEIYLKHFYDSLLVSKNINFHKIKHLCDLGTGAGFPSVPLKILYPHLKIFLIDSVTKKTVFLNSLVNYLGLKNILVFNQRIEEHDNKYNYVIARALGKLNLVLKLSSFVTRKKGFLITMKGPHYKEEFKKVDKHYFFKLRKKFFQELPYQLGQRVNLLFQKIK